jgi:transposase
MARTKLINKLDSTQQIYVCLDVHKDKWSVCIIHQEEVIESHTIPGDYQPLKSLLKKYEQFLIYSTYEAGFLGFYLHRYLEQDNINNIVVSPNKIPTEVGNYVRPGKRDAKKISFSLSKTLKLKYIFFQLNFVILEIFCDYEVK